MREKGPAIGSDRSGGVLSELIESAPVKFGTKRPQVQILSPDQRLRRSQALLADGRPAD